MIFHLLNYPQTSGYLTHEIRHTFATATDIHSGRTLSECRYLRACIDEALRLSPPVGDLLPQDVLSGGVAIEGHYFRQGIDIGIPHYALHHRPTYFEDPFVYYPAPWMTRKCDTIAAAADSCLAFSAFSIGSRSCVGKRMAYTELTIFIARIVGLFEMKLAQGSMRSASSLSACEAAKERECMSVDKLVSKVQGPWVAFRQRQY